MQVVQRWRGTDSGASRPALQPIETPEDKALKGEGSAPSWKAGRYRHVQISELFSMEICNQAVVDFLAATDVGRLPPRQAEQGGQEQGGQEQGGQVQGGQEQGWQEEGWQEECRPEKSGQKAHE